MKKFLFGAAVGYVLGTRAGRARYEQFVRIYRKLIDHPAVQGAAGIAWAKTSEKVVDRVWFVSRNDSFSPQNQDDTSLG